MEMRPSAAAFGQAYGVVRGAATSKRTYKALAGEAFVDGSNVAAVDRKSRLVIANIESGEAVSDASQAPMCEDPGGVASRGRRVAVSDRRKHCVRVYSRVETRPVIFAEDARQWVQDASFGGLHTPCGLVFASDDEILVADSRNARVRSLRLDGEASTVSVARRPCHRLAGCRDVAIRSESDDTWPFWFLGDVTHDEAVRAMEDCEVGDWRVRNDAQNFVLCYVSKSAWRRADADERLVKRRTDGRYVATVAADALPKEQAAKHPAGVDVDVEFARLAHALDVLIRQLRLRQYEGFCGRRPRLVAVADTDNERVVIFEYASRVGTVLEAMSRWAGERRLNCQPLSVAFAEPHGDLVVAAEGSVFVLAAPSYHAVVHSAVLDGCRSVQLFGNKLVALVRGGHIVDCGPLARERRAGDIISHLAQGAVASLFEFLGYREAKTTLATACTALAGFFHDLRCEWRLFPLQPRGNEDANGVFDTWARSVDGCLAHPNITVVGSFPTHEAAEFAAMRARLNEVCERPVKQKRRPEDGVVDYEQSLQCAVSRTYGGDFWWRRRQALAAHFSDLATPRKLRERYDDKAFDDLRRPLRASILVSRAVLDRAAFLELWTRIEEHRHGLRPWPSQSQPIEEDSMLIRAHDHLPPLATHLRAYAYLSGQVAGLIDRATSRQIA